MAAVDLRVLGIAFFDPDGATGLKWTRDAIPVNMLVDRQNIPGGGKNNARGVY